MHNLNLIRISLFFLFLTLLSLNLALAQITVNSDFEGGNGIAEFIDEENNEIHITSEYKAGDTKNIVYYVKISGLDINKPLILEIDAFWRGPAIVYSFDQINWHKSYVTNLDNFNIPLTSSTIFIAHSYPYTYSDMISDVNAVADLDHVEVFDMAVSEGGRAVKLVKITDNCIPNAEKELIWIFGRMHAFENPGNLSAVGMMNYFASDEESAVRLRKEAIIYIVPMMDVDMAYIGGSGKDQNPVDFNRDWRYLNHPSYWEAVKSAKLWINFTAQQNNLSVFFDSHSPAPSHSHFSLFYYVYDAPHIKSNINFINDIVEEIGGYRGDDAVYSDLDISTSQDYALSVYDNPYQYNTTMETGFKDRPDGENWTRENYILNGEYHGRAISDFIHGHAYEDDLIIDNNDPDVIINGNWSSGSGIYGFLGEDYLYSNDENSASVIFNATVETEGTYEVFTRWVSHPDFAVNVPATFSYNEDTVEFELNMTRKGGNWVSLGIFTLNAGEEVSLTISNTGTNQTVIADGLRISKVRECHSMSIREFEKVPFNFILYPNPATDKFTVQLQNMAILEDVSVFNLAGQLVLKTKESSINTSTLSKGIYLVAVKTNQGEGVRKLIVR